MRAIKKLSIGCVLFFSAYYFNSYIGGADGMTRIEARIRGFLFFLNSDLSSIIASLFSIAIGCLFLYCYVSGLYRICTFNRYIPAFEDKTPGGVSVIGHSDYPNINRVLSYRESKLASLDNDSAMELMKHTAVLDTLYTGYNKGSETQRVLSYAESKLSGMSSDRALNYLSNKL
jgi:hypothetical protein